MYEPRSLGLTLPPTGYIGQAMPGGILLTDNALNVKLQWGNVIMPFLMLYGSLYSPPLAVEAGEEI